MKYDHRNLSQRHELEQAIENIPPIVLTGTASPVNTVTPNAIGQIFVDTTAAVGYLSTGLANANWKQITNV